MKSTKFNLVRYDADEGYVFDWKEPRDIAFEEEEPHPIQEHLYVRTLVIGEGDSIYNYVEVKIEEVL